MEELINYIAENPKVLIVFGFIAYSLLASRKQMQKVKQNRPVPGPVPAMAPVPPRTASAPVPARREENADEDLALEEEPAETPERPPANLGEFMAWLGRQGKKAPPPREARPDPRLPQPMARTVPRRQDSLPELRAPRPMALRAPKPLVRTPWRTIPARDQPKPPPRPVSPPRHVSITQAKSLEQVMAESPDPEGSRSTEPTRAPIHLRGSESPRDSIAETAPAMVTALTPCHALETLLHRGPSPLARAVLAQEILGKPVSLK